MRKSFKTIMALTAGALVLTMQLSAFAAAPSYTPTTTYNNDGSATVTLSGFQGVDAGEQVAFYAVDNNGETAWVDQVAADALSSTYTFTMTADQLAGVKRVALSAGDSNEGSGAAQIVYTTQYIVTLTTDENGYVQAVSSTEDPTMSTTEYVDKDGVDVLTIYAFPNAGYEVASYQIDNGTAQTPILDVDNSFDVTVAADCTVKVNFAAADNTSDAPEVVEYGAEEPTKTGYASGTGARVKQNNPTAEFDGVEVISKIVYGSADTFGIIVSPTELTETITTDELATYYIENTTSTSEIHAFKAFAYGTDGRFSVQVVDSAASGNYFADKTLYVYVFAANENGVDYAQVYNADGFVFPAVGA